jgi:gliding motility-associated-like protein
MIQAQNALVLNGGITVLNGGTSGAPVYLVVNEPNTSGITRLSGHIHSENQYNFVKWMSGTGTGNYIFPFGVAGNIADYIPFTFNKTTAGGSDIDMSTWQTNIQNVPHAAATNVGPVTSMTGTADSVLYALDRFWDIQTSAATTADLTFSYLGIENTTSNPTDTVKSQHWNGSSWDPQVGPGNLGVVAGVGTAGPFMGQTTFSPWILSIIPNCPTAVFSYPTNYCDNDTTQHPVTFAGGLGGTFSVTPAGLAIDTLTGTVIPANSTPGTYTVTYTIDSTITCPQFTVDTTITINPTMSTPQNTSICQGDSILLGGAYQTAAGTYLDTLANVNGCDSVVSTTLAINPAPIVAQNAAICTGDSLFLGGAYQTISGVYNDTLTAIGGCDSIVSTTLTVNTFISSPQNETICPGDSILLGGAYQTLAGIYNDTLTSAAGCDSILMTTLTINPYITSSQNATICFGDSILLGGAYQTLAGVYNDTISATTGCDSIIATTLAITPQNSIAADPTAPICFGDPMSVSATGSGSGTVTWYSDPAGTTIIGTGSPFSPTVTGPGSYTYYVTEEGACPSPMDSVIVVVGGVIAGINAAPTAGPIPLSVYFGNTSSSGLGITYTWDFGDGSLLDNQFDPTHIYTDIGVYTATLIVTDGVCSDTISIAIDAFGESAILIPNVFTPNGDGSNDFFTVDGVNLESVEGEIFNRWGQKMFAWNNVNGSWDGRTLAGSEAPDGTYFYIITAVGQDDVEYFKKGAFSLIR